MEEKIPYIAHEGAMARMERTVKRLIITVAILAIMLFACNACWLYAWCQYDYEGSAVTVDGKDGNANYIGNDGEINNGENSSEETKEKKEKR